MIDKKKEKELKGRILDYERYSFILLSLSTFIYLGLVIPTDNEIVHNYPMVMISGIIVLLITALFFNRRARLYRLQLEEEQEKN